MLFMSEFISSPFIQRALIAGIFLGAILPSLGVFVTLKRVSFFGDGIAHASLAGIAIGIVAGVSPFGMALILGMLLGAGVYWLEKKTRLSSDAIIGIFFTSGMALGIVLLNLQRGYQPELLSFLFGSILSITINDVWMIAVSSMAVFVFLFIFYHQLVLLVFDKNEAWLAGIKTDFLELVFYIILALAVVLGVKLLGIILVSALLITPPATAKLFARSFNRMMIASIVFGELAVAGGIALSYILDVPTGAVIILVGTALFFVVLAICSFYSLIVIKQRKKSEMSMKNSE